MLIKSALRSLIESPNLDFGFAYATVPCKWVQEPNLHWLQVEETCPRRFQMNVVHAILFLTLLFYNHTQNISYVKINVTVVFPLQSQTLMSMLEDILYAHWQRWDHNSNSMQ